MNTNPLTVALAVPILVTSMLVTACAAPERPGVTEVSTARQVVDKSIASHGGEAWNENERITWTLRIRKPNEPPTLVSISFPTNGAQDIQAIVGGRYMTYRDGKTQVWDTKGKPTQDPAAHADADYILPTVHYVWSLPWKLRDPGTRLKRLPSSRLGKLDLDAVRVTFDPGTGEYPQDWYDYRFDRSTGRVHSVLFEEHHPRNRAFLWLDFEGQRTVGGLTLPTRWVFRQSDAKGTRGKVVKTVELVGVELGHHLWTPRG